MNVDFVHSSMFLSAYFVLRCISFVSFMLVFVIFSVLLFPRFRFLSLWTVVRFIELHYFSSYHSLVNSYSHALTVDLINIC